MINIDFSFGITIYMIIVVNVILLIWFFDKNRQKKKDLSLDERFIWFCSICTYTYVNTKEEVISICPRCGNYNKR